MRTFAALGGVPEIVVPDNLKAAVTRAHRYEPELNRTYADLAHHYGVAVIPARAAKPRDKAKVEVGVQVVERWIVARLRHHTFFALAEVNAAIGALLPAFNARPFKKLPGSRQSLFETLDRPALKPLPAQPYEYAEWKRARVNIDYHVEVEGHYYSVPYALVKQQLEVRVSAQVVELFHKGHPRGEPPALAPQRAPQHGRRAHAHGPPALRGMDAAAADPVGGRQWSGHRAGGGNHSRLAPPSPTRLPVVFRHHAAGEKLWHRAAGSRLPPCPHHRRLFL